MSPSVEVVARSPGPVRVRSMTMAVAARNAPLNSDDEFCDKHGLFYEISCPECSQQRDNVMAQTTAPEGDKERRAQKRRERQKKNTTCDFCDKAVKRSDLCRCELHSVRYCKTCAVKGTCPDCAQAKPKKPCTALVPVGSSTPVLPERLAIRKRCGCPGGDGTSETTRCVKHDTWYCPRCTKGRNVCPKCDANFYKVSDSRATIPECSCYDRGVRFKGISDYCTQHKVFFCKTCHGLCPMCKSGAIHARAKIVPTADVTSIVVVPKNYPLAECPYHGWFCTRCDKKCPECENLRLKWQPAHCDQHDSYYCIRCGLGCLKCGKKEIRGQEPPVAKGRSGLLQCGTCSKIAARDCPKHGFYCLECDGVCLKCDGCYTRSGVMYHKCGGAMEFCSSHKKYYCNKCGQRCRLCPKYNLCRCGLPKSRCEQHGEWYCGRCVSNCPLCAEEKQVAYARAHKHHCGSNLLFCARHRIYFCPACDDLCKCACECGVMEKYYKPTAEEWESKSELESRWEEFQYWRERKNDLFDCVLDLKDTWEELTKFMFAFFLTTKGGEITRDDEEEAVEQFVCMDQLFRNLFDIIAEFKSPPRECQDAEIVAQEDAHGNMCYTYSTCPVRVPSKIKVTVEEFLGDDLSVPS